MNLYPWKDVCANADKLIKRGVTVYQQWQCSFCRAKQTMPDANVFYEFGQCEECTKFTDIKKHGMNLMTVVSITPEGDEIFDIIDEIARQGNKVQ